MNEIDRLSNRVSTFAFAGLLTGASTATYKALPIFNTSVTTAISFALTSTACLIPERIIYHSSFHFLAKEEEKSVMEGSTSTIDNGVNDIERKRLIGSHIGGGVIGGFLSGSLFQKKISFKGIAVFTPIMIGVAFAELQLQDYRRQRLIQIGHNSNFAQNEK